jgi:GntR family transcriptional regulator
VSAAPRPQANPGTRAPAGAAAQRQPKYLRIYAALRDRISSGRWAAGAALPAQRELADEFGVSIMTLRQALQLLADDGLIDARHGSGTYVAARYAYDLGYLRSFAADLAAQGARISTRVLAARTIVPPEQVAARLGGPDEVLTLRRLQLLDGRPVIVSTSYLPAALVRGLRPGDLGDRSEPRGTGERGERADRGLYTRLAELGLAIAGADETITPVTLSPADARDLGRPEGSPALLSHRLSFTADGIPVLDDHAVLAGDSVAITASRSPDRLEVHYTLTTS